MAYTSLTDSTHSKWWITGTGSVVNRLSEVMDDQADGPYYTTAAGSWTASAGDAAEFYHAPTKRPDNVYCATVKLTETADNTCIDGGGGGLANGQWCWETVNSRVYVQIAAGDPDGVVTSLYYDWNGSVSGTNFMTEVLEDVFYTIYLDVEIGDGATTTALSWLESVYFTDNPGWKTTASATLTIGSIDGSGYPTGGAYVSVNPDGNHTFTATGSITNIYGSVVINRSTTKYMNAVNGTITIKNSTIFGAWAFTTILLTLDNMVFSSGFVMYLYPASGSSMDDVKIYSYTNIWFSSLHVILTDTQFINVTNLQGSYNNASDTLIRNPKASIGSITKVIGSDIGAGFIEDYSVDITVVDKDGNALSGVTFNVYDDSDNDVTHAVVATTLSASYNSTATSMTVGNGALFAINDYIRLGAEWLQITNIVGNVLTVTRAVYGSPYIAQGHNSSTPIYKQQALTSNASGVFSTMYLPYKFWMTTAETEYAPGPYKFVLSKAGYETLSIENVTIDAPIDWHLELRGLNRVKISGKTYFQDDTAVA